MQGEGVWPAGCIGLEMHRSPALLRLQKRQSKSISQFGCWTPQQSMSPTNSDEPIDDGQVGHPFMPDGDEDPEIRIGDSFSLS